MPRPSHGSQIVEFIRRRRVSTVEFIRKQLEVARATVFRALRRHGYYCSCNFNSIYVTLAETPRFGADGIWSHGEVRFSRHGTLKQTVAQLVDQSGAGMTVAELRRRLHTRVCNQLSELRRDARIGCVRVGRCALYVSANRERAVAQRQARQGQQAELTSGAARFPGDGEAVPAGMDAAAVIAILVQMIETDEASAASVAKRLQHRGLRVNATAVRAVTAFYGLEKKRPRCSSHG